MSACWRGYSSTVSGASGCFAELGIALTVVNLQYKSELFPHRCVCANSMLVTQFLQIKFFAR